MKGWMKKMLAAAALSIPMMFTMSAYAQTAPAGGEEKGAAATAQPEKKTEVKKVKKSHRKHVKKHVKKAAPEAAKETKAPAGTESAPAGK